MKLCVVQEATDRAVHAELPSGAQARSAHLVAGHRFSLRAAQTGRRGLDGVGVVQREARPAFFAEEGAGRTGPVVCQLSGGKPAHRETHPFTPVAPAEVSASPIDLSTITVPTRASRAPSYPTAAANARRRV